MVIELFVRKWKKEEEERIDEQNRNFHVFFSTLLWARTTLEAFSTIEKQRLFVHKLLSHFGVVFRELLPYLKYRQHFEPAPFLH